MTRDTRSDAFKSACNRAWGMFDGIGKGGVKATLSQEAAVVEMQVLCVREGATHPPMFLQHPAHLPDGVDLKKLMTSTADKDEQLKADAREWSRINRDQVEQSAVTLRTLIRSIRMADELLNDPDSDEQLHGWMHELQDFTRLTFACDTREAPTDPAELDAWCLLICNKANPVPQWLQEFRGAPVARKPTIGATMRDYTKGHDDDD